MRKPKTTNLQEERWQLGVTEEWMNQLLLHDYESSKSICMIYQYCIEKKGRGLSSLLISKVGTGGRKRRKTNDGQVVDDQVEFTDDIITG